MNQWLEFLKAEAWPLLGSTASHLELVMEALALASLVGVPVGIAAARRPRIERLALGVANILQTIPSLALLGFLLIVFRGQIGKPPALAALALYALLPILKNTILGLRSVDRGVLEASTALGMTNWQRLWHVELPLAAPIVLGGVRVATVASVGMATIAAAIGARGLGSYIFRGVSLADTRLILLGSVPAALLALACDASLGELERATSPERGRRSLFRTIVATLAVVVLVGFAGWGWWLENGSSYSKRETVTIGSKDGTEMILLGHMLADLVEAKTSLRVDRRFNLGGTLVCFNALKQGGLDAYIEYTGTALTVILDEPVQTDPDAVLNLVRRELAERDAVACLEPFGFENTFALLMRRDAAERLGVRSISQIASRANELRAGFGPEFMNRPDGYPGLAQAYGLNFATPPREMDRNLLYQALGLGSLDLAAGDSTDGRIAAFDLIQLEDDRRYFPPYQAVPLVREETLGSHPELRPVLELLAGEIDAATMRKLNREVDEFKKRPEKVARDFLRRLGLLDAPS